MRFFGILLLVISWLPLLAASLEGYQRVTLLLVGRRNPHVIEGRDRLLGFAAALDGSLWEKRFYSYHPSTLVERDVLGRHFEFQTDAYGFRNAPLASPKPPGIYRIVCIGGSTTVEGWTNASTYPGRLQARLREVLGTDRIEVVNCGISGYTAAAEQRRWDDYMLYEPDLVLEYNGVNDLWQQMEGQQDRLRGAKSVLARSLFLRTHFSGWFQPSDAVIHRRQERIATYLGEIADRGADAGVDVVFVTFARPATETLGADERDFFWYDLHHTWPGQLLVPAAYSHWIDLYNDRLRELCRSRGIPCVDVAAGVRGGSELFLDTCHMTDRGIEVKTEALLAGLLPIVRERLESSRPHDPANAD